MQRAASLHEWKLIADMTVIAEEVNNSDQHQKCACAVYEQRIARHTGAVRCRCGHGAAKPENKQVSPNSSEYFPDNAGTETNRKLFAIGIKMFCENIAGGIRIIVNGFCIFRGCLYHIWVSVFQKFCTQSGSIRITLGTAQGNAFPDYRFQRNVIQTAVRVIFRQKIIHGDTKGIKVGARIGLPEAILLRCRKFPGTHQPCVLNLGLIKFLGGVKVDQFYNAVITDHNIGWLDVAVDDRRLPGADIKVVCLRYSGWILCIVAGMDRKLVRRVLENYGHRDLYVKDTRDIIIATYINNQIYDLDRINDELFRYGLATLNGQS
mgnify:CR=1 FL=1